MMRVEVHILGATVVITLRFAGGRFVEYWTGTSTR
jgi:hypothetical protein